jgi:hypothetical protein
MMIRFMTVTALAVVLMQGIAVAEDKTTDNKADQTAANELVDKVIKAHGGKALAKVVAFEVKMTGTAFGGDKKVAVSSEGTCQGYDKQMTVDVNPETKTEMIEVINGDEGWTKDGDKPAEKLDEEQVKSRREGIYMNWITTVFPFKEKEFKFSPLEETSVVGHKAVGLLVRHEKHNPVKMYFDSESYLLVKTEQTLKNADTNQDVVEETVYSDYKTARGIKQPYKMVNYADGTKIADLEVTELKIYDKAVDERLFSKP